MKENPLRKKKFLLTHRGYGKRGKIPENSIEAFDASTKAGFSGHELDVRLTRDGFVVIFHGPNLSSTTEASGYVERKTFDELRELNCGSYLENHHKKNKGKIYRIPSLEEYLNRFGKVVFTNIEIKKVWYKAGWSLEKKVIELIEKFDCHQNILISSFNLLSIYYLKKKFPEIRVGLLLDKKRIPSLWIPSGIRWIKPDSVHIHKTMASEKWIEFIHKYNCAVALWAVNEFEELKKFRTLGVEIIITDNMELVNRV